MVRVVHLAGIDWNSTKSIMFLFSSSSEQSFDRATLTSLAIGAFIGLAFPLFSKLPRFFYNHFIHGTELSKYHHVRSEGLSQITKVTGSQPDKRQSISHAAAAEPWALITGASDGIGASYARSLSQRGFNIILHGRNPEKLHKLISNLSQHTPGRSFIPLVLDASDRSRYGLTLDKFIQDVFRGQGLNLTVLINNIGGLGGLTAFTRVEDRRKAHEIEGIIDVNATFPVDITQRLLPTLKQNSPALIVNVCSMMSVHSLPYLSVYCGCKAFNWNWGRSLRLEMMAERAAASLSREELGGKDFEVEVLNMTLAQVKTAGAGDVAVSLFSPESDNFVENYAIHKIGTGWSNESVCAYWPHALQSGILDFLPGRMYDSALLNSGKEQFDVETKVRPGRNK